MAIFIRTVGATGRDYSTLQAAYNDIATITGSADLVSGGHSVVFEVYDDANFTERVTFNGVTADVTNNVTIIGMSAGKPRWLPTSGTGHIFTILDSFITIMDVEILQYPGADQSDACIRLGDPTNTAEGLSVYRCKLEHDETITNTDCVYVGEWDVGSATYPISFYDCIIGKADRAGIHADSYNAGVVTNQYFKIINTDFYQFNFGFGYALANASSNLIVVFKNCLGLGLSSGSFGNIGAALGTVTTTGSTNNYDEFSSDPFPGSAAYIQATTNLYPGVVTPPATLWLIVVNLYDNLSFYRHEDNGLIGQGLGPAADADIQTIDYNGYARSGLTAQPGAFEKLTLNTDLSNIYQLRNDSGGDIIIDTITIQDSESIIIWDTVNFLPEAFQNYQSILNDIAVFNEGIGNGDLVMIIDGFDLTPTVAWREFHRIQTPHISYSSEITPPVLHAASHILNASDEIDGDRLSITYVPTNYTRSISPLEVDDVRHLTAHLAGIDDYISNVDGYIFVHANRHENGGADEIEISLLGTFETNTDLVLKPDGYGGVEWAVGGGDGYIFAHSTRHEIGGDDEIEISSMATFETDTDLVLKPDGYGGVEWAVGGGGYTTATAVSVGTANTEGVATSLARSDHTHQVTGLTIASQAQGDILYRNATDWVRLPAGTTGHFLRTLGAGADPAWAKAVRGPAVAVDNNSIMRWDGTTGDLSKGSFATIDNNGYLTSVRYIMGSDMSLIPIVGSQSVVTSWHGLQLVGNRQATVSYTPTSVGTANQYGVLVPSQDVNADASFAVIGASSQTGDLVRFLNNSLTSLFRVTSSGNVSLEGNQLNSAVTVTFGASEYNAGSSVSGTLTINWNNGQMQVATITGTVTTVSMTAPAGIGRFSIRIVQGGSGNYDVSGWTNVKWVQGVVPLFNGAAGTEHIITFEYRGSGVNYYAVPSETFS